MKIASIVTRILAVVRNPTQKWTAQQLRNATMGGDVAGIPRLGVIDSSRVGGSPGQAPEGLRISWEFSDPRPRQVGSGC